MQATPRVWVSILNWNNYQSTISCLESVQQLTDPAVGIVVVDNASLNDSVAQIQAAFPNLHMITTRENLGFAGGHALALDYIKTTGADFMWMLNNDAKVSPDTLQALLKAYQNLGEGVYGSVPLDAETRSRILHVGWSVDAGGQPLFLQAESIPWKAHYDTWVDSNPRPHHVANINGSSFMIPLALIDRHGFMDESFFLYGEETDYCFRLAKHGIPSYIVPESVITHERQGATSVQPLVHATIEYYRVRNRLRVIRTYLGWRAYLSAVRTYARRHRCLRLVLRNGLSLKRCRARSPKRYFACRGLLDALRGKQGKVIAPEDFWHFTG